MKSNFWVDFTTTAKQFADKVAIVHGQEVITYSQFEASIRQTAHYITTRLGKGHAFIPIVLPAGIDYMIAQFGVWMSGNVFVPLDNHYASERLNFICTDCHAPFVFDSAAMDEARRHNGSTLTTPSERDSQQDVVLYYTSGSTGNPKGILHTNASIDAAMERLDEALGLVVDDVFVNNAPMYFVASAMAWSALNIGATVHLLDDEVRKDASKLEQYVEQNGITTLFVSPRMMPNFNPNSTTLRRVFTGSERLSNIYNERLELVNLYGMSETFPGITSFKVDKSYENTPIGKPASNISIHILSPDGEPVAPTQEGELCIGGVLAKEYFNSPEKTAELYRGGVMHTGDIVRMSDQGNLIYVNRCDWMVKINGQRVEPGEVEAALMLIDQVKNAVVKGFENEDGSQYLCGYYTENSPLDESTLREKLCAKLPSYMIPTYFVKMESLPINQTGKIDRKSLLPPDVSTLTAEYVAPSNEVEKQLCEAFEKILKIERVGVDDDFFRLGGDSIRLMSLQAMCTNLPLSSKMIFEHRTIRKIATECIHAEVVVLEKCDDYPLSETQMGIYIECMGRVGEAAYNNPRLYKLDESTDTSMLARAIEAMVEAHPFIKTQIFTNSEGQIRQRPGDQTKLSISVENLSEQQFEVDVRPHLVAPFDLHNDRLFRFRIFETEGAKYLFFDLHHIIFDGTSCAIMFDDICRAYRGETLLAEEFSGFDVAQLEQSLMESNQFATAQEWVMSHFGALDIDVVPLPDKKSDVVVFDKRVRVLTTISRGRVAEFCAANGITENILFTAAYGYLLSTYSNSEEALFATIYNGRSDIRSQRTIGMMVKTLPVYCRFDNQMSIRQYLNQTKETLLGAMNNDLFSFARLCAANPAISSRLLFAYQGDIAAYNSLCGAPIKEMHLETNATAEQLSVQVFGNNDNFRVESEYFGNLYSTEFIDRLLDSYEVVLGEFIACEKISQIRLISNWEIEFLDSLNNREVAYDRTQTIVSLFAKQVLATPDNLAVVYNDIKLTYKELDEITNRLAQNIKGRALGREDVVSILIPRCEFIVIASLGVLKAGCAYQPLDPTYPAERLNFMMGDAGARLLITDASLRDIVSDYTGDVLLISNILSLPADDSVTLEGPLPNDLFTLLYTSGSTGVPKGCMLEHSNLVCFCDWYIRNYDMQPGDGIAAYASYGFDANMMDLYPALTSGATIHVIDEAIRLDLSALNDYFELNNIKHGFMTTQVGRQFATSIDNHSLRHLTIGGEKLAPLEIPTAYNFYNAYGPTECTILTTLYQIKEYMENIPIGKGLDNMKLYIIDKRGHRVPVGAIGELCIAGPQVSRGYLNRPEATAKAFEANPFCSDADYNRIYHSGDIVRWMNDGNIEFVGRKDAQVKIRGFRIELTEVESIIRQFKGIKNVTVQAFDTADGSGKFVAAYIVADEPINIDQLNDFIMDSKPPYMVPAVTMQIDKIPLNQNQKVNKKALPTPERQSKPDEGDSGNRVMNILEIELKDIVSKIVGSSDFGLMTNLGYAGLTSISGIKLSTVLHKRFGVIINPKGLLKTGSIHELENIILTNLLSATQEPTSQPAKSTTEHTAYPLSYSQQGVYFDCMKRPTETTYNIPIKIRFDANSVTVEQLDSALREILEAHEYLMTHFEIQGEEIVQTRSRHEVTIGQLKLSESELSKYKSQFVRPFNLHKGPLYRFEIVTTDKGIYLLADFHHLIFDGASCDLFINTLCERIDGKRVELESYSYFDCVANEKEVENGTCYQRANKFFDQQLRGCESASEISADLGANAQNGTLSEVVYPLGGLPVESFCKSKGITPAQLFLASTFYTVSRFTNNKEVYISTISNGRSDIRTANTFGMFVKTLPLATKIDNQTIEQFIVQTGKMFDQTIENENYPFAKIAADYNFLPEIMYACQLGVLTRYEAGGRQVEFEGLELKVPKFKLSVHIEERDSQTCIVLQYNDALYSEELMQTFAESMATVTAKMIENPKGELRKISMISPAQELQISSFRMAGKADVPISLFHNGLEAQAVLRPDHTALIAIDDTLSYRRLNEQANLLAHALIKHGIGPGARVAILLPRTSRLIISMFGVMKAGAAYIPCDPDYPTERIKHILEDSGASCIITTTNRVEDFEAGHAIDVETLLLGDLTHNPQVAIQPNDPAYLIYTSGSTGKPKGVVLHHAGICNYLYDNPVNQHVHAMVTEAHITLSVTTISFDMSLKEIATTLFNGLTLVLANEEQANNPILLAALFEKTGADVFNATPSRMLQYMELPAICEALSRCKVIMSGGEKYADNLLQRLQKLTKARIFNTYGPTEITVSSNCKELTHESHISIGRPLLNYHEFIVDTDGNELPAGVVGELYIGGVGVAVGYNNLPQMTSERFVEYKGVRVYKSGDYAKWTSKGDVVVLGRTDNQVKLRGLRIELGEIEGGISKFEGVGNAMAMIRVVNGTEHICAYFTANRPIDIDRLKDELKKSLASYMIPTAYCQIERMPLTANGKIDTKVLPEPTLAFVNQGEIVAAANKTEQTFCDIFAKILGLEKVGATDNFFDLGGTSLVVTRVIIESANAGLNIAYGDLFSKPTPRKLATTFAEQTQNEIFGSDYDYTAIDELLRANTLQNAIEKESQPLGNVLLTGATGFLGIHILKELLDTTDSRIYCLLRGKTALNATDRLKSMMFYYFEQSCEELLGKRIVVIDGDVTKKETFDALLGEPINTVINCSANVKHFSKGTDIEDVNIGGAQNIVDFCLATTARMIHVSTMSVNGMSVGQNVERGVAMNERMLYFGQFMDNKYVNSKFIAERLILQNIATKGLNAKIMRVGNLSARDSDGEYQINFSTNSFMGRLKAYRVLGACPYSQLDTQMEFSPIDQVSKAIVLLSSTPRENVIFHPYNLHFVFLGDILNEMKNISTELAYVEDSVFNETLEDAKKDPAKAKVLSSIIAYQNMAHGQKAMPNIKENSYTMQVLYRHGFRWSVTSWDYIDRMLVSLNGLGFFDNDEFENVN